MAITQKVQLFGTDPHIVIPAVQSNPPQIYIVRRILVSITNIDPQNIECTKQHYVLKDGQYVLDKFNDTNVSEDPPYTRLDLNLNAIKIGHKPGTEYVVEVIFWIRTPNARFHPELAVTASGSTAEKQLKYLMLGKPEMDGHIRQARICSLRPQGTGPVPFNLGILVKDTREPDQFETLMFYDPKIENDGTITSPPPEPPPPPPWP